MGDSAPSSTFADWRVHRDKLVKLIDEATHAIGWIDSRGVERLEASAERVRSDVLRIVFAGGFNTGKSTLVNAFVGQKILPMDDLPASAFTTILQFAEVPWLELFAVGGGVERQANVGPGDLERLVKLPSDVYERESYEAPYSRAVLGVDYGLLRDGVEVADTAGLNEDPTRSQVTHSYLANADTVVYVTLGPQRLTAEDRRFLDELFEDYGIQDLFFAINKIDQVTNKDGVYQDVLGLTGKYTREPQERVFCTNALAALEGQPGDGEVDLPGFVALQAAIERHAVEGRASAKLDAPSRSLAQAIESALARVPDRLALLDSSAAEIQRRLDQQRSEIDRLRHDADRFIRDARSWLDDTDKIVTGRVSSWLSEQSRGDVMGYLGDEELTTKIPLHKPLKIKPAAEEAA